MRCLLYIPAIECEGTHVANIASVRVGGLTLLQRVCRSLQNAEFDEIIIAKPDSLEIVPDKRVTIPIQQLEYNVRICEASEELLKIFNDDAPVCVCVLDGMITPECLTMRPHGADVRIIANKEQTGIYFVCHNTLEQILKSDECIDDIEGIISETFEAPEKTVYHRMMSSDDAKIAQNLLTKSLRKPLGRDSDGLIAYFINRPISLQISKRIANSFITPNMVTAFGLIMGLAAAALMFLGIPLLMVVAVLLWQLSSIIDGIDGELARMRMSPSHKGEWFDTVADDITNISFLVGLGHAVSVLYKPSESCTALYCTYHNWLFYIACGVALLMTITVLWFYREFVKMGIASHNHFEWGFESENKLNKKEEKRGFLRKTVDLIAGGFAWIAKRDFYTFLIMCLVIFGLYLPAYGTMLIGASCVGIGGIIALTIRAIRMSAKKHKEKA